MPDEGSGVWVRTVPNLKGSGYMVVIEIGMDRALRISPNSARKWALNVIEAVTRVDFDVAVMRQLATAGGVDEEMMVMLVNDLRTSRPALKAEQGLKISGGVARDDPFTFRPFMVLSVDDEPVGQWTTEAALSHAMWVLGAMGTADLDAAYQRLLVRQIGVSEQIAEAMVSELQDHRDHR